MKLQFSKAAVEDLMRLKAFIAEHNYEAAEKVASRLRGAIQGLIKTPQIGRPVTDIQGEVRELIFGQYIIRYEDRQNMLFILRIWHGKESR